MSTTTTDTLEWLQENWKRIVLYAAQGLLALPAAYASSQFAAHFGVFPPPFNYMVGIAFEWVTLGTLLVAGSQAKNKWYVIVNALSVVSSIMYVTLHSANKYGLLDGLNTPVWLWAFSVIHGAPLATLGFCYGNLIHTHLMEVIKTERATAYKCPYCGAGFGSTQAVNGHLRSCTQKP